MRILIINYRYFVSGGPERYLFNVTKLLEDNGHEVIPFSIKSSRNEHTKYEKYFAEPIGRQDVHYFHEGKKGIRFSIDTISRLFYSFHVRKKLSKLIKEEKPDVAYLLHHYNKLSPSVISACKSQNLKVVARLSDFFLLCPQAHFLKHGQVCEECLTDSLYSCVKNRCIKNSLVGSLLKASALFFHKKILRIYSDVDLFVSTTQFMKNKLMLDGINEERIKVLPTFFSEEKNSAEAEPENNYILYFGRFNYEKGVDLLLNAYYESELYSKGIKLMLVGGELSEVQGVDDNILDKIKSHLIVLDFIPQDKLNKIIYNCMFTVIPSRWYENLPNSILESYKHLKPVIANNIGSLPEVVINNKTGLLFDCYRQGDLSEKLKLLADDDELRQKIIKNIISENNRYSPLSHLAGLEEILK